MSRTLLFRLQSGKIRVLEEMVESWKPDHEGAMLALDLEDLVVECLSAWEDIRRAWARTRRQASINRVWNLQEVGTGMLELLDRALRLLAEVAGLAERVARDTGHTIEGSEGLPEAIREARELREHVHATWPWDDRPILKLDRRMIEESRAARARGESLPVADILAQLQANPSERPE